MRRRLSVAVFACALAVGAAGAAQADTETIRLTGGSLNLYLGDPSSATLVGDGFSVSSMASGGWPVSAEPGDVVDFSTDVSLSNWGPAQLHGLPLRGDPNGPGAGRLWISGSLHVVAAPFAAPPPSGFTGSFSAPVTVSGTVSGYYNANGNQPPLFTVNVVGRGTAGGNYRLIDNGGEPLYLNNNSSGVSFSGLPGSWAYGDVGAVGQIGNASYSSPSPDQKVFTVRSAGADIWGTQDSFGYLYQPFVGDGWITAEVLSLQNTHPFAKVGVMLRESLAANSPHVILDIRPNGMSEFMTRSSAGGATTFLGSGLDSANVALYRNGSVVTGYTFGEWLRDEPSAARRSQWASAIFAGVAVTSHDPNTLTTATFRPPVVHELRVGTAGRVERCGYRQRWKNRRFVL